MIEEGADHQLWWRLLQGNRVRQRQYLAITAFLHYFIPFTVTVCILFIDPSRPRRLYITRVFQDGVELNWIPPRETNGDIQHYIIKYTTQNGTEQEINTTDNTNYYNLTGLERGQTYNNITVVAVNAAGRGRVRGTKLSHIHNPRINATIPVSSSDRTSYVDHTKGITAMRSLLQTLPSTATDKSTITTQMQVESTRTSKLVHAHMCNAQLSTFVTGYANTSEHTVTANITLLKNFTTTTWSKS